jgi:hypothetical protein
MSDSEAQDRALERERELDLLCERWAAWCCDRRLSRPAPAQAAEIVRRGGRTRPLRNDADAPMAQASMAAFHIAYTCQPDSLDKQVFDLYYVARVTPIKAAAAALGIGRSHFYRVLEDMRRRLVRAARAYEENGIEQGRFLNDSHSTGAVVNSESVPQIGDKEGQRE